MNELFYDNGHLTPYAFSALLHDEPLEELARLEISEHLSYCDKCVTVYADMLEESLLLSPPEPVVSGVMRRIRERARKIFINKYATAVVAASFAIVFWNIGLFDIDISRDNIKALDHLANSATSFTERTTEVTESISESIYNLFSNLTFERGSNHEKK